MAKGRHNRCGGHDNEDRKQALFAQLEQLFMKIDANSDGTVDFDEFLNYILVETEVVSRWRHWPSP